MQRRFSVHRILVVVLMACLCLPARPSYAGSDGQQLRVSTGASYVGYTSIKVSGDNQDDNFSEWSATPNGSSSVTTTGWWWQGRVTIEVAFTNGTQRTCSADVPSYYHDDVYEVTCGFVGGWDGQQLRLYTGDSGVGYGAVSVSGKNQDGNQVTWTGNGNGAASITTTDWWWIGPITANVAFTDGSSSTCTATVPQIYESTIYAVQCSPSGTGGEGTPGDGGNTPSRIHSLVPTYAGPVASNQPKPIQVSYSVDLEAGQSGNLFVYARTDGGEIKGCGKLYISMLGRKTYSIPVSIAPPARPAQVSFTIVASFHPGESNLVNCPAPSVSNSVEATLRVSYVWSAEHDWQPVNAQVVQVMQNRDANGTHLLGTLPIVSGKEAVVRVFVQDTKQPSSPAPIQARLVLTYGSNSVTINASNGGKVDPSAGGGQTDAKYNKVDGSLNFVIPGSYLQGGVSTSFYVEINTNNVWEHDDTNNRLPASGAIPLTIRQTRSVRVSYLNITATQPGWFGSTNRYPGVATGSEHTLAKRIFPADVSFTPWRGGTTWERAISTQADLDRVLIEMQQGWTWSSTLDQLYGFYHSKITGDLDGLLGQSFPDWGGALTDEDGNAVAGQNVVAVGQMGLSKTFAHELGHNYGMFHPCELPDWHAPVNCVNTGEGWHGTAEIGASVLRHDGGGFSIVASTIPDFMSQGDLSEVWVSPPYYQSLANTFNALTAARSSVASASTANTRDVTVEPTASETAGYIMISGVVSTTGGVLLPAYQMPTAKLINRAAESGSHALRLLDADGTLLAIYPFTPESDGDSQSDAVPFVVVVPFPAAAARIQLTAGAVVLAEQQASSAKPSVTLLSPNGGETWLAQAQTIRWSAADADGDPLTYSVLYSPDQGATWLSMATGLVTTSYTVDARDVMGSDAAIIRVVATDGFHTAYDDSDATFTIVKKPPLATILSPHDGAGFREGEHISFIGQGFDLEDDLLNGAALTWYSDRDGQLGTGAEIGAQLSVGRHRISFEAQDSDGMVDSATITVVVYAANQIDITPPSTTIDLQGTAGLNGWFISPVIVSLSAADAESGVAEIQLRINGGAWSSYQAPITISDEGQTLVEYRAIDRVGNIEAINAQHIQIDTRRPVVDAWVEKPTYTRVELFPIHVAAEDPMPGSGIATATATFAGQPVQPGQLIDLFWFDIAMGYTVTVVATDTAGWSSADSASFTLIATLQSLNPTVERLYELGHIKNEGLMRSFSAKIDAAIAADDRGQPKPVRNQLEALLKEISSQEGKGITLRGAELLRGDIEYVLNHL